MTFVAQQSATFLIRSFNLQKVLSFKAARRVKNSSVTEWWAMAHRLGKPCSRGCKMTNKPANCFHPLFRGRAQKPTALKCSHNGLLLGMTNLRVYEAKM